MPDADRPSLTLTRRYAAPPARVYAAWTQPALIARWWQPLPLAGPAHAEVDLRVGGRYRIVMQACDGETHDVGGEYRVIEPACRLVFTWAWASTPQRVSLVTVEFGADGDGTLLTLTHERFFDAAACDGHRRGWSALLEALTRGLDTRPEPA